MSRPAGGLITPNNSGRWRVRAPHSRPTRGASAATIRFDHANDDIAVPRTAARDHRDDDPARRLCRRGTPRTDRSKHDIGALSRGRAHRQRRSDRRDQAGNGTVSRPRCRIADGYVFLHGCETRPDEGPAGILYVHFGRLLDGVIDRSTPDALLYGPRPNGPPKLLGVELAIPLATLCGVSASAAADQSQAGGGDDAGGGAGAGTGTSGDAGCFAGTFADSDFRLP